MADLTPKQIACRLAGHEEVEDFSPQQYVPGYCKQNGTAFEAHWLACCTTCGTAVLLCSFCGQYLPAGTVGITYEQALEQGLTEL